MRATKEIIRKYYKIVEKPWAQPILTSNSQDSYNITGTNYTGSLYVLSDGVKNGSYISPTTTSSYGCVITYTFPLTITLEKVVVTTYVATNVTWDFGSFKVVAITDTGEVTLGTNIPSGTNNWGDYTYQGNNTLCTGIKVYCSSVNSPYPRIGELTILGTEHTVQESTQDDYDFYKDVAVYKVPKEIIRKYYKYGATPNANIIGTPTISNGVASSFNSSNYLTLPSKWNGNLGYTFEMVFKFNLNSVNKSAQNLLAYESNVAYNSFFGVRNNNVRFRLSTNESGTNICDLIGTTALQINTDYWVKADFDGNNYRLYLSTNGIDYTLEASKNSTSKWSTYTLSKIGVGGDNVSPNYYLDGYIDLKQSYIKVDDSYWWRGTFIEESTEYDYDYYKDVAVFYGINQ